MKILLAYRGFLFPKFNELTLLLPATQPSVICLTETWLTPTVSKPEVTLDSYTLFRSDRAVPRRGGGVALYGKSLLMPTRLAINAISPCVEMVGCQFSLPSRHIAVLLVYRSPRSTESDDDIVLRVLRTVARLHGECLILGDLNAPHVN